MTRQNPDLLAFNRGLVSPGALARIDVERTRLSASVMTNWLPKTEGPMRIRPGTKFLGRSKDNWAANFIPFVASTEDTALIELTGGVMRVWIDDMLLTRPTVSTSISNGSFMSSSGWTNASTGGVGSSSIIDLLPKMTAATTNGITVSASTDVSGARAWQAADDKNATHWQDVPADSASVLPSWWKVDFGSGNAKTVASYSIRAGSDSSFLDNAPAAWSFQGSNDNSSWTTEDSRSGQTGWAVSQARTYTVASPSSWRYYRLNVTAVNGDTETIIGEIQLFEAAGAGQVQYTTDGLVLNATASGSVAKVTRAVTVPGGNAGIEHTLVITISRGPVVFRCGSSAGADDYVHEASLGTGQHHLAFTPTGNFHMTLQSDRLVDRIVQSVAVAPFGTMELASPWSEADIDNIRFDQSADVVFVDCFGVPPKKIERRGSGRSWSIVDYTPASGPFMAGRSALARLRVAQTFGDTTLTADQPFFTPQHVGALFTLFHNGQSGVFILGRDDVATDAIEMTGVGDGADTADRRIKVTTSGGWSGTITIQRSVDGPDIGFRDTAATITTNTTTNIDDADDNLTVWYRLKIKPGNLASGTVACTVTYNNGGRNGICRVSNFQSNTVVDVEVLQRFSSTEYSDDWRESHWSPHRGWPSAVALHEGRLFHAGGAMIFGSVSDDFENFDGETLGDSGPIVRSLGRGPVDRVCYLMPLLRLVIGTAGAEIALRASSTDEILTPSNHSAKPISTQGSASLPAVIVDSLGVFVQRSRRRVFAIAFGESVAALGDYEAQDLTRLVPDLLNDGVVHIGVQRQPDTRLHFVLGDGRVALLSFDKSEQLVCWSIFETEGAVERVVVLPGQDEDRVYYLVRRVIDGATSRSLEGWAMEVECEGGALNWIADSAVVYSGSPATTINGLDHLEGEEVVVWADGSDMTPDDEAGEQQLYTVSAGAIVLPESKSNVVVGLPYRADWQSTKLAYSAQFGTPLAQVKRVNQIAFILANVHNNGLFFGRDFDHLDALPRLSDHGAAADADRIFEAFDRAAVSFPGSFNTDVRICLRAKAPRPVTVMAAVPTIQVNEKV
jgi:hypothetical protein